MQDRIWCEDCNAFVTYKTKDIIDTFEVDGIMITCPQKIDICDVCGNTDCVSIKTLDYDVLHGHKEYMKQLLKHGFLIRYVKHLHYDCIKAYRRRFKYENYIN